MGLLNACCQSQVDGSGARSATDFRVVTRLPGAALGVSPSGQAVNRGAGSSAGSVNPGADSVNPGTSSVTPGSGLGRASRRWTL